VVPPRRSESTDKGVGACRRSRYQDGGNGGDLKLTGMSSREADQKKLEREEKGKAILTKKKCYERGGAWFGKLSKIREKLKGHITSYWGQRAFYSRLKK